MELQKRFHHTERPTIDCSKDETLVEQHHKDDCDVNKIIPRYERTGILTHLNAIEGTYGDLTGFDFETAANMVANANSLFEQLPGQVKKRFRNSPAMFLDFMDNPNNADEMVALGLATLKEATEFKTEDTARKVKTNETEPST